MTRSPRYILTVNGGSSSIKFALFDATGGLRRLLDGTLEGIGRAQPSLRVVEHRDRHGHAQPVLAADGAGAVSALMDWIATQVWRDRLLAVGHRVVHGGPTYHEPQRVTDVMLNALKGLSDFDPAHLPLEIALIEAFSRRYRDLAQVACFDTGFHHDLPRVARQLAIPRHYEAQGLRRYGFHGLSYAYLTGELARLDGTDIANGRVILAHLGHGASLAAVRDGNSIDTSMGFTPAGGIPMGTRSGDLDPGLVGYLARTEGLDAGQFNALVNAQSGLLGLSETSSDMRELLALEVQDVRAAEAVALFCYQVRKWIGGFAAALGGLDTLVFSGGVGENAPRIRERICEGLGFLGIQIDPASNARNAALISPPEGRVSVRVIHTDEERMIARSVAGVLALGSDQEI